MITEFTCIKSRILLDLPHILFGAESADGPETGVFLSRFFHNKPSLFGSSFFQCYLSYYSPEFIYRLFSLVGLVAFFVGVYFIVKNRRPLFLAILLFAPICLLFEFPKSVIFRQGILFAGQSLTIIYGLWQIVVILKKNVRGKEHMPLRDRL